MMCTSLEDGRSSEGTQKSDSARGKRQAWAQGCQGSARHALPSVTDGRRSASRLVQRSSYWQELFLWLRGSACTDAALHEFPSMDDKMLLVPLQPAERSSHGTPPPATVHGFLLFL
ncbi:hypothetical protein CB1_001640003 [Camelus ferus]|nr:hypothetical protein CB1_001640003 [Camelus ferus]